MLHLYTIGLETVFMLPTKKWRDVCDEPAIQIIPFATIWTRLTLCAYAITLNKTCPSDFHIPLIFKVKLYLYNWYY